MGCGCSSRRAISHGIQHPLRTPIFPRKEIYNIDPHACKKYCNEAIARSWFKDADTDGSGAIDFEEFKRSAIGKVLSEEEAKKAFVSADLDNDGQIDFHEFVAALEAPKSPFSSAVAKAGILSKMDPLEESKVQQDTVG